MKKLLPALLLPLGLLAVGYPAVAQQPKSIVPVSAATRTLTGRVTDSKGQGLPGVTVLLKGTRLSTSTNADGRYVLAGLPAQGARLLFSFVGFTTQEVAVPAGSAPLNVVLRADNKTLSEVVVSRSTRAAGAPRPSAKSRPLPAPRILFTRPQVSTQAMPDQVELADQSAPPQVEYYTNATPPVAAYPARAEAGAGDTYAKIKENAFHPVGNEPLSTFSLDVDNASYSNVRRFLNEGQLPPRDAVRVEEMLNYFRYELPAPAANAAAPVRISAELSDCPWAAGHQLARIGIQAKKIETASLPPANLVFLVDVSGSMMDADRLPLIRSGLKLLVRQLRPQDHVALVAYAGAAGLVLPPTAGSQQNTILEAIDRLEAGGSTAGGAGLRLAYSTAQQHFKKEGNNRVILASDGDFNVGESSDAAMEQLIVNQRETGVFLTVLGVGRGNLHDSRMELLADKGNGNYAYLDNLDEARRTLVAQFGGTLFTVAKDVKLQVEFNPARVASYRLIGYENRLLANEDFNNDRKDAGELGAGHTVTALYEIVPTGAASPLVDKLKYQPTTYQPGQDVLARSASLTTEVLTVKLRYKEPQGSTSQLLAQPLAGAALPISQASVDQQFAAAVAEFGLLLRQSEQRGTATYASATQLAQAGRGPDADGYRAELLRLVQLAEGLAPAGQTVGVR
ncbi:von Willebrand factor type A domain-containing protein [Hymenobacter sp. H14-R3]|uniref:vWA domain-containing protein n=1 Tax=Hymenobacter sp. H14-R3 TaxID=3046308 RepID=UPI0024BA279F|nr:von Willebrand factor type A domain-containing protein [Hymenobacter sp. H14-R3]MDJ0366333.1 von Willebrand factor type A domain-containing protein [Hymenobacter sp. H14-R3]